MGTCMSDPVTREDIQQLCASLDRLSLAVRESGLSQGNLLEGWEVVEPLYQGPGLGSVLHHRLEEGPPETPEQIAELAKKLTSSKGDGPARVREAFVAGFWARIALECHVKQLDSPTTQAAAALRSTQYLVVRASGLEHPVRVLKADEKEKLVGKDPLALHYGFPSLIEVQAFCCGADIQVPALYKWSPLRSSGSGSAQTVTRHC